MNLRKLRSSSGSTALDVVLVLLRVRKTDDQAEAVEFDLLFLRKKTVEELAFEDL